MRIDQFNEKKTEERILEHSNENKTKERRMSS